MERVLQTFRISSVRALQLYNLQRFAASLLIGVFLAKNGVSKGEISIYEALLFLGNLLSFFWIGGGQNALLSLFPKWGLQEQKSLIGQVFYLFLLLSILAAGILWLSQDFILHRLTKFDSLPYLHWLCWYLIFNIPTYLVQIILLLRERYQMIIRYSTTIHISQLVAVIFPIWLGWGLEWSFILLLIWAVLKFSYLLSLLGKFGSFQLQLHLWGPYIAVATPLLLHLLIGNSVEYIDGLIVTSYFPDAGTFAVFRYGARELPLTTLLVGAVVTAMIPVASSSLEQGMQDIRSKTLRLSHWLFPISAGLMLFSPWLFTMVYTMEFQDSAIVFNWYLLILGTRILLPQVLLIAKGHNYFLVISAIIETVVNVGLSLWWVRSYGLGGIAAASVVANLINKLNMILYCRWRWGIRPGQYISLPWYFSYLALLIAAYIISDQWWNLAS
ncbi:MAG: hypothetical protein AAGH79_18600 [Bacteroidota bacterium]